MPFYDFLCKKCNVHYTELCSHDSKGKYPKVCCPECGSKKKEKIITGCNFQFAQPEGTDRWNSDTTGHDYRFKHKWPKVQEERKMAEAMSHMGNPYTDNSAEDINLDVGIHDAASRKGLS